MPDDPIGSPVVSIIIPCFLQAQYLEECLQSVIKQTTTQWEAIVVDDASPDGDSIREIVSRLRDSRIHMVRHAENRGLAASRNTGVTKARAPLLSFVDADDVLEAEFCTRTLEWIVEGADVVYCDFRLFGETSGIRSKTADSEGSPYSELRYWIPGAGVIMRRSVWEAVGGYCEADELRAGMEDRDFWIATIPLGLRIEVVSTPLYAWRRYGSSMSHQRTHHYKTHRFIARRHRALLKTLGVDRLYLAEGYYQSALAFLSEGKALQTLPLLMIGLYWAPHHLGIRKLLRQSASALVPLPVKRLALRPLKTFLDHFQC